MNKASRILGWAFLFQFVTSFGGGVFLNPQLFASNDITATLTNIANNTGLMRVSILVDTLTALGIIFLGAMLYTYLRKLNEKMALAGFGFYILEAVLLGASKLDSFSLLRISQEWAAGGNPAYLLTSGKIAFESMNFVGSGLAMLAFSAGGILFYHLLDKSRIVPRWLALWGLITTIFPCLTGTLLNLFGYDLPIWVYLPYIPFEGVIAIWILVKGANESPVIKQQLAYAVQ
jgi:hypothetical protein